MPISIANSNEVPHDHVSSRSAKHLNDACAVRTFDAQKSTKIRALAINILARVPAQLSFKLGRFNVDSAGFHRVAQAISNGHITVRVVSSQCFYPGIAGTYNAKINVLTVSDTIMGNPVYCQLTIVHEAVHALADLNRILIRAADNEAAAFIAEGMFNELVFKRVPSGSIAQAATAVGINLLTRPINRRQLQPTNALLRWLFNQIRLHPGYGPQMFSTFDQGDG